MTETLYINYPPGDGSEGGVSDTGSPTAPLNQPIGSGALQFPSNLRDENFFTIFRVYERTSDFQKGRLQISGTGNKIAEILLPLPPNMATSYSVDYGESSFGVIGSGMGGAISAARPFLQSDDFGGAFSAAMGEVGNQLTDGAGITSREGLSNLLKNVGVTAVRQILPSSIEAGLNVAKNPYQAIVFNNPKFRIHQFSYTLFPADRNESFALQGIINKFKDAMMPEFTDLTGLYFKYPKVFDIEYHAGNTNNPFIHKISTSALTDFNVDFHGEGTPSYFDPQNEERLNPAPTNIKISMTFQELNFMDALMVRKGY